jgi:asparagine synthase (glutamine-hydrolysing)
MCGIVGLVSRDNQPIDSDLLERMAATLDHRGPDERRGWIDPVTRCLGLSHTRLSVIDREGGRQPMADMARPSRRLVFNGEIYNHHQLRKVLISHGHRFASHHSDTEVILPLYAEHGDRFVDHLRGMFALALYDGQQRRLIMVRDRMGQKPLYWTRTDRHFAFASELKALMPLPGVSRQIDLTAIEHYLALGYIPAPRTIFRGISKLPPACTMSVPLDPALPLEEPRRYWHLPDPQPANAAGAPARIDQLRQTMAEAVSLRLEADVPLGFFLSGGLDSSIVLALARQARPQGTLRTFTMAFDQPGYDESALAATMAAHVGAEHTVLNVRSESIEEMLAAVCRAADEPLADASAVPTWLLSRAARQHVTVILSGDGGDELFGGYDRYRAALLADRLDRLPPLRWLAARAALALGKDGEMKRRRARLARWGRSLMLNPLQRYARYVSPFHEADASLIRGPLLRREDTDGLLAALRYLATMMPADLPILDALLRLDTRSYLPEDVLAKIDRMSMAHGLEIRSPMLDHHLVELAMTIPAHLKMGRCSTGRGKAMLRQAFGHLLPRAILNRRDKMGLGLPVSALLAGPASDLLQNRLRGDGPVADSGLVDVDVMRRYVAEHTQGIAEHGPRLWSLLVLDQFLRQLP